MIVLRQKQYVHPLVHKALATKPGQSILNGAIKVLKSPAYQEAGKTVKAVTKTVKMVPKNPGAAVRRATAGTIINPGLTVAEAGDVALSVGVPAYNAIPVNLKMAAAMVPGLTKTPASVQKVGRDMMRNNGKTRASRFGQRLEYGVNKLALKAGEASRRLSGVGGL
jgi:hypothetical protein